jgi:hypothetical protein
VRLEEDVGAVFVEDLVVLGRAVNDRELQGIERVDVGGLAGGEPGFIDYQAVACDDGRIFSLTMWQDEQGARRSEELAAHFVRDKLAGFDMTRTDALTGDVRVSRARSEVLEPVHA